MACMARSNTLLHPTWNKTIGRATSKHNITDSKQLKSTLTSQLNQKIWDMASRKRASSNLNTTSVSTATQNNTTTHSTHTTLLPPTKASNMLKLSLLLFLPYFYLIFYHYGNIIDAQLKRSILINAGLSIFGFFVTIRLIPVASKYLLRRNMFGYDINKKGTPQGSVHVLVLSFVLLYFVYVSCFTANYLNVWLLAGVLNRNYAIHINGLKIYDDYLLGGHGSCSSAIVCEDCLTGLSFYRIIERFLIAARRWMYLNFVIVLIAKYSSNS